MPGPESSASGLIAGFAATDSSGLYSIDGLEAGTYTVYAAGRNSLEQAVITSVSVEAGRAVTAADLNLTPTGSIAGIATRAGATTGNLGIRLYLAGTSYAAIADDAGYYRIDRVPAGSGYTLVAEAEGYEQIIVATAVSAGQQTDAGRFDLDVHIEPSETGSIAGSMYLGGMTTHAGIFVYLNGTSYITMSNGNGTYLIDGIPPGTYVIMAGKPGYNPASTQSVSVSAGQQSNANPRTLSPEAVAAPTMSPASGQYGADVTVQLYSPTPGATIWITTDGSTPAPDSGTSFSGDSVFVSRDGRTVIRAMCVKFGMANSAIVTSEIILSKPWIAYGSTGSGTGGFNRAWGCARDSDGRIYIVDEYNHRIIRMDDMSGTNWTSYGSIGDGEGQFHYPLGIAVDSHDRLYVADYYNCRIVRIDDMSGSGWTSYGTYGTVIGGFIDPVSVAIGPGDIIYVADSGNDRIVRFSAMNGAGWTSLGINGSGINQFSNPSGVVVSSDGGVYVADTGNNRVVRFDDMSGTGFSSFGSEGSGAGQLSAPRGVAVGADGTLYITDTGNHRLAMLSGWASGWRSLGFAGSGIGEFSSPASCCVDSLGRIYVADCGNSRVVRFTPPVF